MPSQMSASTPSTLSNWTAVFGSIGAFPAMISLMSCADRPHRRARSGSPEMLAEVDGLLRDDPLQAWARGDFAPIAAAIDAMLLKHGWLKTPTPTIQEDP